MFLDGGIAFSLQIMHFRFVSLDSVMASAEDRLWQIRRPTPVEALRKFDRRIGTSLLAGALNRTAEPAKKPPCSASSSLP
jgi:hypothetical protein